jgi:hypothetical protein
MASSLAVCLLKNYWEDVWPAVSPKESSAERIKKIPSA